MKALRRALLVGALCLAVAPTPALAQERRPPPPPTTPHPAGRVDIRIYVVHATDSEAGIDSRLDALASSFRYFKYKGYKLLSTQDAAVGLNDDHSFAIEGGRRLKVTLLSKDDARAKVRVEISGDDGKLLDTTVSINRGGTFIVAGPKYKDGILMLPIRANY